MRNTINQTSELEIVVSQHWKGKRIQKNPTPLIHEVEESFFWYKRVGHHWFW